MALELDWKGKKAYARIETVLIRKGRIVSGIRGGGGAGGGELTPPDYDMCVLYTIYEDSTAKKQLSQGQYVGHFDKDAMTLSSSYIALKTNVPDFKEAKDC